MLNKEEKKMKNLKKILLAGLMLITPVTMASCSFFNVDDAAVNIKNVEVTTDSNGNTLITIYYTDEDKDPTFFTIPSGKQGKEGVGIKNIEYQELEDQTGTIVKINFTDENREPVSFLIKNGEGKKGDNGNGIKEITSKHDDENKKTVITITFTDENYEPISFDILDGKEGEPGRSVSSIRQTSNEDGTETIISFVDQEGAIISSISIPRANAWLSGPEKPTSDKGNPGDFYFETTNYVIYQKISSDWKLIAELGAAKNNQNTYKVSFDINASDGSANFVPGYDQSIYEDIKEGYNFYGMGYELPIATRTGYNFSGWITSKVYNPTKGLFTDLTPVYRDTTLYAYWTK